MVHSLLLDLQAVFEELLALAVHLFHLFLYQVDSFQHKVIRFLFPLLLLHSWNQHRFC